MADETYFERCARVHRTRTVQEIAGLPSSSAATAAELQLMRDLMGYTDQATDDELIALCRWFRGNSRLEGQAFARGLQLR